MALRLLYGSSVSRKTEAVYDALIERSAAHPDQNYIIVVPEQASLQVQEAIVRRHPKHAISNIDVLTFNRLAYRVFEETGTETREAMDDYGKIMLLRLVTIRLKEQLTVLRRGIDRIGTISELKSVISELAQYNISPDALAKKAEELENHPPLQKKLKDLALIYRTFMTAVHEKREIAEERTARLAETIGKWPGASRTTVAFDGFTGFTTPQYEVLRALLRNCPEVIAGVTVGSVELGAQEEGKKASADWLRENQEESALFHMSRTMTVNLKELAITESVGFSEETITENVPFSPEILHLERTVFRTAGRPYAGVNTAVRLLKARKRKDEVAWVLHEIMRGIREDGLRPRDFAVIAGDLQGDREEIEEQFSAAGIPCFIDQRKSLAEDPLIRLLLDALRAVDPDHAFGFDAVFSFAKNPIVVRYLEDQCGTEDPFSPFERIAEAENFARARGLRFRSQYEKEWSASGRSFAESRFPVINETRAALFGGLLDFDGRMKAAASLKERVEAVRLLLLDYRAEENLEALTRDVLTSPELADEYRRIHEKILTDLSRFEDIFEGETLEFGQFRAVLETGLQSLVMGHVPPTKDRVTVGDLRRTRLGNVRRLFVIGANEGVLPADHQSGGLLTDYDREILREKDIVLSATAREMAAEDRYYLYLLLTKPLEQLTLSYRTQGGDGSAMLPGELSGILKRTFEGLEEEDAEDSGLARLNSADSGIGILSSSMRDHLEKVRDGRRKSVPSEEERALFWWLREHSGEKEALERIFDGLYYSYQKNREMLSPETAGKLWSDTLNGSVSFFEKYAECPYAHFLNYGLKLEDRPEYEINAADLGTILHNSIDEIFKKTEEGTPWYDLEGEELETLIRTVVEKVVAETNNGIFNESERNKAQYGRILRIVTRTMKILSEQWKAGDYTNTKTECSFGYDRTLPGLTIPLKNGRTLALRGRIDRIDTAQDGNDIYVKIIDYKSSGRTLDYTKIWYGLQLQLPLYLRAAVEMEEREHPGANIIPGGLYYYGIDDPVVTPTANKPDPEELIREALLMQGLTNSDPKAVLKVDRDAEDRAGVVKSLKITKSGEVQKSAKSASGEQMKMIGAFSLNKTKEFAEDILSGQIPVRPYQLNQANGCRYCSFRGVCGFDRTIRGYDYHVLEKKDLTHIVQEEEGGAR